MSFWYHGRVDINVKGVEPEVADRLARQAAAEGLSQQEWIRQVLRQTAGRLSPAELLEERATTDPMSEAEFTAVRVASARRRQEVVERIDGRQRRR